MTQYRLYREGKSEIVTADAYYLRGNCLTLQRYEQHAADAECQCEEYLRFGGDDEPQAHRCTLDIVSYAADCWRRIERLDG